MKLFAAKKSWVESEGNRLDAFAYSGGALAIRDRIQSSGGAWCHLGKIAHLFNGPRFARIYVRDRSRGIPFLSSSDILLADLDQVPWLSVSATTNVEQMVVKEGWTLISRSGTIGNTAYVRPEMAGMTASEHVMRAVPTDESVMPGYLFAFLSSSAGQAMLLQRTYGSVIQHIEPHHVADVPVPIPDHTFQKYVNNLVDAAARARSQASHLLNEAASYYDLMAGTFSKTHEHAFATGRVCRSKLANRLDAFHHIGWAREPRELKGTKLAEFASVTRPGIVKRIYAERGVPFVSGIDVYQARMGFRQRLMLLEAEKQDCFIRRGQILVQRSGQRYGLLGRPAYVGERADGWAAGEHLMRINLGSAEDIARVFAFLRSEVGRRCLLRFSYGTSIPELNPDGLRALEVPPLPYELAFKTNRALALREQADADEEQAILEVESWLS